MKRMHYFMQSMKEHKLHRLISKTFNNEMYRINLYHNTSKDQYCMEFVNKNNQSEDVKRLTLTKHEIEVFKSW